jgi:glutaredoxin
MSNKELNKFHFDTLYNYKIKKENEFGLGLLDMRIKSKNQLNYAIEKINSKYSFFSIKVYLEKESERNKILKIKQTSTSPKVILDEKNGIFSFCGNCYPENAIKFFDPILTWLKDYAQKPRLFNIFEFKFKFLSTASQKEIIKIMSTIENIATSSTVIVKWYFEKNNDDSLEFAIEFSKLFNLDFNIVEFDKLECNK